MSLNDPRWGRGSDEPQDKQEAVRTARIRMNVRMGAATIALPATMTVVLTDAIPAVRTIAIAIPRAVVVKRIWIVSGESFRTSSIPS